MIFTLHFNKLNLFSSLQHPAPHSVVANTSPVTSSLSTSVGTPHIDVHGETVESAGTTPAVQGSVGGGRKGGSKYPP